MKCLSIREPWASLILRGIKDVENRKWSTRVRGCVAIHASRTFDRSGYDHLWGISESIRPVLESIKRDFETKPHAGHILGEVDITACVSEYSSMWFSGPFGFILRDPAIYVTPVPFKGRLMFFEVPEYHGEYLVWGKKTCKLFKEGL